MRSYPRRRRHGDAAGTVWAALLLSEMALVSASSHVASTTARRPGPRPEQTSALGCGPTTPSDRSEAGLKSQLLQSVHAATRTTQRPAARTPSALSESPALRRAIEADLSSGYDPDHRKTAARPLCDGPSQMRRSHPRCGAHAAAARAAGGGQAWHSSCALYRKLEW